MAADLRDVLRYVCSVYPRKHDLSKARVAKIIYLADWRSAIQRETQLTDLNWTFYHYGPYLDDVVNTAQSDPALAVVQDTTMYGTPKEVITLQDPEAPFELSTEDQRIIDEVIEQTRNMNFSDFLKLVYSTYPVVTQPRYVPLDLVSLAKRYNANKDALGSQVSGDSVN
jgi:hypothetical protein